MIIEIEVGGAKQRVNVDDSFKNLTPEQQQQDVDNIAQSLSAAKKEAAPEGDRVSAELRNIMFPIAGGVAGTTAGGVTTAGRIIGGLGKAAKAVDPVAMEEARRIAERNAVETWARTQHRVPGMVSEKPGLYFGQPRYDLEAIKAKEEMAKMIADPEYQAKVLAEQKPAAAQYAKRVAQANPSMMQKVGRFLGRAPMGAIAGGLTGLGAGMQAADAANRLEAGDKLGGYISGIGALGTGLSMIPTPVTRLGGTAVGIGALGLNAYIDYLRKNNPFNNPQVQQMLGTQPQPAQMADGGKVKPLSKAQKAMKHFANGGSVEHFADGGQLMGPKILQADSAPAQPAVQLMGPLIRQADSAPAQPTVQLMGPQISQVNPATPTVMGMPTQQALQDWKNAGSPNNYFQTDTPLFSGAVFDPLVSGPNIDIGMVDPTMKQMPQPMFGFGDDVRYMSQVPTSPIVQNVHRNSMTQRPVNAPTPFNPFNPNFAAKPVIPPTTPRPGQMPRPPVTVAPQPQAQPNRSLGMYGPISQHRMASGLSSLVRKPIR